VSDAVDEFVVSMPAHELLIRFAARALCIHWLLGLK